MEMLADETAVDHHARVAMALGMAAQPGTYEALLRRAEAPPRGEVPAAVFRARRSLLLAMGHLARRDDRALAWLAMQARATPGDPGWSAGAMRGERLGRLLQRLAVSGLGLAARPEADAVLDELEVARSPASAEAAAASQAARAGLAGDRSFGAAIEEARGVSSEIRARGAAAVLGPPLRRSPLR